MVKKRIGALVLAGLLGFVPLAAAGVVVGNTAISVEAAKQAIGKAKARKIALKDAGLKKSEVELLFVEKDYDDGVRVYEVSFRKGNLEYEYTIDMYTGRILDKDIDRDDD